VKQEHRKRLEKLEAALLPKPVRDPRNEPVRFRPCTERDAAKTAILVRAVNAVGGLSTAVIILDEAKKYGWKSREAE
jgi:hypothetical protein